MTQSSARPIVERFTLRGLNGYKTIELSTNTAAKIISAENGTGKTTILNALYGVLSGKYRYLKSINFESLSLKFSDEDEFSATRQEIMDSESGVFASLPSTLVNFFTEHGLSEDELPELVEASRGQSGDVGENPLYQKFYLASPHSKEEIIDKLVEITELLSHSKSEGRTLRDAVASAMAGHSVLYFPTYRRIETEIPEYSSPRRGSPRYRQRNPNGDWSDGKLINFGLRDVELRLDSITDDIRRGTFEAYARISGRTLDQLVSVSRATPTDEGSYNIDAIKVVLGRIGKSGSATETRVIELIESGIISRQEHDYLRYFLHQMVEVYREKQLQESAVEKFVKVVDSYWDAPSSEKSFEFDKVSAVASVKNKITGETLKLNALSSGEKQVISIFAKLYLELSKKYIVLIDEPELSLSMEWQRRFLPDILAANSCSQLIAITHSPFVFDNELDPFAGPLKAFFTTNPAA